MRRRKEKDIIIVMMLVCVLSMAVGYAALRQVLQVEGTAEIDSVWNIKMTSIESIPTGRAVNAEEPTNDGVSGTFKAKLYVPGDKMEYKVTITNLGTLDAFVESATILCTTNEAINCSADGLEAGYVFKQGETKVVTIVMEYNPEVTTQPENLTSEATFRFVATQADGDTRLQSYIVTFNPGTGTVSPANKTVYVGSSYGTLPTPTKPTELSSSYSFDGWYTAESGGTKVTSATVVNLTSNQTLYARWKSSGWTVSTPGAPVS